MTREKKEQISNRLVMNFGILLLASLVLLYVRSALSSRFSGIFYTIILVIGILCLIGSIVMFVLGKKNSSNMKNYSAIPFGVFIGSVVLYLSNGIIPGYRWNTAALALYILMAAYFIVMAVITAIQLHKPTIKNNSDKKKRKKK